MVRFFFLFFFFFFSRRFGMRLCVHVRVHVRVQCAYALLFYFVQLRFYHFRVTDVGNVIVPLVLFVPPF